MSSEKLEAALEWLADGHVLAQLHGINRKGNCTCAKNCGSRAGKHPVHKDPFGEQHGIRTPEQAGEAFRSGPYNIGLVTGLTGIVVLDVDVDDGKRGQRSLDALAAVHGWDDLTSTRQHRTGGGGLQYLFHYDGPPLKTSLSEIGPDLDFKAGDGGAFIVLPPSRSGKGSYEVLSDDPIQPLPGWLLGLCQKQDVPSPAPAVSPESARVPSGAASGSLAQFYDFYAEGIVEKELDRLRALQGARSGWTMGIFGSCCALWEIANSSWNTFGQREIEREIRKALPRVTDGSDFDPWFHAERARIRVAGKERPAPVPRG